MTAFLSASILMSFVSAFGYNILIAFFAMLIGCPLGALLGKLFKSKNAILYRIATIIHSVFCNVPSFVLLFYFTLIVPAQLELAGGIWSIPPMAKAILALSIPVIGYFSELYRDREVGKAPFSLMTCKQFFLVILMASTTASVIGVPELLATANTFIASSGELSLMLPTYLLVALFFVVSGLLTNVVFNAFSHVINGKLSLLRTNKQGGGE